MCTRVEILQTLTDNKNLAKLDALYAKPDIVYTTAFSGEYELNVVELRPPMMDLSGRTKYPVLFQVSVPPTSFSLLLADSSRHVVTDTADQPRKKYLCPILEIGTTSSALLSTISSSPLIHEGQDSRDVVSECRCGKDWENWKRSMSSR